VWGPPAATVSADDISWTATGVALDDDDPSPSRLLSPFPQHLNSPLSSTPHVWRRPASTAVADEIPWTVTGVELDEDSPLPS
jgi:hypothetical protein